MACIWHLSQMTISIAMLCRYAECHYAEYRILFSNMVNVVMLSVLAPVTTQWRILLSPYQSAPGYPAPRSSDALPDADPEVSAEQHVEQGGLCPLLWNFLRP